MRYFSILLILLFACNSHPYKEREEKLVNLLQSYQMGSSLDKSIYLITITGGCGGCMQEAVKFIKANVQDNRYQFIISTDSKKAVNRDFDYQVRQSPNFLIDTKLLAQKHHLVEVEHPIAYFCKNNKVIGMRELTYQNADSLFRYMNNFLNNP